jgi:hypothetical protein
MLQMKYVPSMIVFVGLFFRLVHTGPPAALVADRLRHGRRPLTLRTRFELGNVVAWMMVWDAVMLALAALVPA